MFVQKHFDVEASGTQSLFNLRNANYLLNFLHLSEFFGTSSHKICNIFHNMCRWVIRGFVKNLHILMKNSNVSESFCSWWKPEQSEVTRKNCEEGTNRKWALKPEKHVQHEPWKFDQGEQLDMPIINLLRPLDSSFTSFQHNPTKKWVPLATLALGSLIAVEWLNRCKRVISYGIHSPQEGEVEKHMVVCLHDHHSVRVLLESVSHFASLKQELSTTWTA